MNICYWMFNINFHIRSILSKWGKWKVSQIISKTSGCELTINIHVTIVDASIKVIKYLPGPHDHYVCIGSQVSLNVRLISSNYQLSLGISNAQKFLDLMKLSALQYISTNKKINYFFLPIIIYSRWPNLSCQQQT